MKDNNAASCEVAVSKWVPPTPTSTRNYPYNCWWVAALSEEVGQTPLGRWLLDMPVLLYRADDGQAVVLEGRCPHRGAPLAFGCRKGDAIQCGYHGFTFAATGECINVPSIKTGVPPIRIRAYTVIERPPLVWVYLGDPAAIDSVPPPLELDWTVDPSFAVVTGRMDIKANYMLLKENVLDLTHFGFVHASTFKITDWVDPPQVEVNGDIVRYRQHFERSPLPPPFAEPLKLPIGTPFNRENYGSFISPALQIAAVDFIAPDREDPAAIAGQFRIAHATTPIDATSMHYFYLLARDHGKSSPEMQKLAQLSSIGFAEDEKMIEGVQQVLSHDPRPQESWEVSIKTDAAGVQARRALARWMQRET
jgi:phenylpropionate dioxygenase-like ring-hydroxylating dioxygenase large terminal subunit